MAVKTNWTDGEILTASDVSTYCANSGLVFITSLDIDGSQEVWSVPTCFSIDYDDYLIKISRLSFGAVGTQITIQLEAGGVPSTTNYYTVGHYLTWGTSSIVGTFDNSKWYIPTAAATETSVHIEIQNPYANRSTYHQATLTNAEKAWWLAGKHTESVVYDGFRLIGTPYNITGSGGLTHIDVYGYRHPNQQ